MLLGRMRLTTCLQCKWLVSNQCVNSTDKYITDGTWVGNCQERTWNAISVLPGKDLKWNYYLVCMYKIYTYIAANPDIPSQKHNEASTNTQWQDSPQRTKHHGNNELQSEPSSLNLQWNQRNLIQKLNPKYSQPNCCRRLQLFCLIRKARWAQWLDMLFLFSRSDLPLLDKLHNLSYVV